MNEDQYKNEGQSVKRVGKEKAFRVISLISVGLVVLLTVQTGLILVISKKQTGTQLERMKAEFETSLQAKEQAYASMIRDLRDTIQDLEAQSQQQMQGAFGKVSRDIKKVDKVYSGLLEEQKKKTLDTVYSDLEVQARYNEARALIDKGKFGAAYDLLGFVVQEQSDNLEARYYLVYSLFNINRLDRNKYALIQKEINFLRLNGFEHSEMKYIEDFIKTENGESLQ